jgi:peptidoglycan/xylan/chitin deacetylase (PgdA/CDA1 family)
MTLIVQTASFAQLERTYILTILLSEFLGLSWQHQVSNARGDTQVRLSGYEGEIFISDFFFNQMESHWLHSQSLPTLPLLMWDTRLLSPSISLVDPMVPIIYGNTNLTSIIDGSTIRLPIDIFGSAFFMLTRYEEAVISHRDNHDRFPTTASLAYQAGFLHRPIIDEYVEILWAAIHQLWPGLQRRSRQPRTLVSCDVDNPYEAYTKSWKKMGRRLVRDILKRRDLSAVMQTLDNRRRTLKGDYSIDPMNTFDWMMETNEKAGNRLAFYFLVNNTVPDLDGHYSIHELRIRQLMRRIHERGHEIGLHGSYGTYRNGPQLKQESEILRGVLEEERINQPLIGVRQHYLRWSVDETPYHHNAAGLAYDTTLSYADHAGFRCGTCHEYPLYDLHQRHPLRLQERPLIIMECSVLSERYMGLGYSDMTLTLMRSYKETCHRFSGDFTLLWHNSYFGNQEARRFYRELVS